MTDISSAPDTRAPVTTLGLLLNSSKLIIAVGVVGAIVGFGASQVIKPKWAAKMTVQVGQLATATQAGITLRLVENQLTAADRYNLPTSKLEVIRAMGLPDPDSDRDSKLVFDTLRASTGKSPDVISLQVSGYTREAAIAAMSASFKVLAATHSQLFDPTYTRMKAELDDLHAQLNNAENEYDKSVQSLKSNVSKGNQNAAQDMLVTNLANVINSRILNLKQQSNQLQEALEPSRTYPTRVLGEPYVPEEPSTPGTALLVASGLALGLGLGALFAFVRRVYRP